MKNYSVVKYSGTFGFIKPWTAVRDSETFSQQFLTPSIVEGMEKKLFPELLNQVGIFKICRHRLNYQAIDVQQERTWSKGGFRVEGKSKKTNLSIINRGVMLNPNLYIAFLNYQDAENAFSQHICLCRNEDLLLPEELFQISQPEFDEIPGFELSLSNSQSGFKVGHNRFCEGEAMFGELKVFGNPIRD